jgi:alpha-galactosidase
MKIVFLFLLLFSVQTISAQSYDLKYQTLYIEYENESDEEKEIVIPFLKDFENDDLSIQFIETKDATGIHYKIELLAKKKIELEEINLHTTINPENYYTYFCNGFQSWTTSKEFFANEKIDNVSPLGKLIAKYYGDYSYFKYKPRKGNLHSWTYTYLRDTSQKKITLLASVAEHSGFTVFSYQLKKAQLTIIKEVDDLELPANTTYTALEWLEATGDENELFKWYAAINYNNVKEAAAKKGFTIQPSKAHPAQGWTSWYHYYRDIATDTILKNLRAFERENIPIHIFQIDDGYQKSVGEWTQTNPRFPQGMKAIADSIHAKKIKAGLWLAPYIAEKKSDVFRNHKDWLLKNDKGKIIKAGYNPLWSGWYYPLDIYNKEAQQYLKNTFDTVLNKQGYDMVKLDFLFAACINPPDDKTRGEMMFDAMLMLREWCGEKYILGCGVPLGTAFHLVDYCRISSDIHMKWEQKFLKMLDMRERLSVWNTITSNIGRQHLDDNMFLNDPDVFVLRDEKNKLKWNEKELLFEANNMFGSLVFTSDYIGNYNDTAMQLYKSKFPLTSHADNKIFILKRDFYAVVLNNTVRLFNLSESKTNCEILFKKYGVKYTGKGLIDACSKTVTYPHGWGARMNKRTTLLLEN